MRAIAFAIALLLAARAHAAEVTRIGSHVFHSSFWISLHERLRHEALARVAEKHAFTDAEQAAWQEAIETCRKSLPQGNPALTPALVDLTWTFVATPDDGEPRGLPAAIDAAIRRAAPVYRAKLWKDDDRANRFWIAMHGTLLSETGPEIVADLEKAYGITWPKTLRIEVTPYAEPFDAYTPAPKPDLFLSVIASRIADQQGFGGLEILFHEPLHHFDEHFETLMPEQISHAVLFYAAGELTRRALARRGVDYKPIAYAQGIHQRSYPTLLPRLETHWQAYLDGKVSREEALRRLAVHELALHSDFHVNLHQRLMADVDAAEAPKLDALAAADREVWEQAVAEYRAAFKGKAPWLDAELIAITQALGRGELPPKLRPLLERTAPVYRKYWWSADDAANRAWIAKAQPLIDRYRERLAAEHARVYGTEWPLHARIDIAPYGGVVGAYTTNPRYGPHTIMSSTDPGYQGYASLEMVFHETSHSIVFPSYGVIGGAIAAHAKRLGVTPPRELWHAILFYTSGELTRRVLAADGIAYDTYGLPASMRKFQSSLERWWTPVIDGQAPLDEAIAKLLEEVTASPSASPVAPPPPPT